MVSLGHVGLESTYIVQAHALTNSPPDCWLPAYGMGTGFRIHHLNPPYKTKKDTDWCPFLFWWGMVDSDHRSQ